MQSASDVKTRDFSGVTIPTITESIADFVDGKPSLTRAKVGPLILGCDSMFLLDGECYGKPHSARWLGNDCVPCVAPPVNCGRAIA